jgi:hypothetical protein
MNRLALRVSGVASLGAAIIHFALGPHHVEELGVLGLGFYLAGILQLALAVALLYAGTTVVHRPRVTILAAVGFNVAVLAAWVLSRVVGLPAGSVPWTPEAIGVADSVTAALEIIVVTLGLALLRAGRPSAEQEPDRGRARASIALAPAIALIAAATAFAVLAPDGTAEHMGAEAQGHADILTHEHSEQHSHAPE